MQQEGVFSRVFYHGQVQDSLGFVAEMRKPTNLPVFVFGPEPLGVAWLNGLRHGVAFVHFCGLKSVRGRSVELGKHVVRYWFDTFTFLHVLMGTVPSSNRLAARFASRLGFNRLGEVPKMLFDANENLRVGGTVFYYAKP